MKHQLHYLLVLFSFVAIASCAAHPGDIAPKVIPAHQYKNLSCEQLETELATARNNLATAEGRQKRKRKTDIAGNILLLPGLLSIAKDSNEAVARYKGEVQAITRALDTRCTEESD